MGIACLRLDVQNCVTGKAPTREEDRSVLASALERWFLTFGPEASTTTATTARHSPRPTSTARAGTARRPTLTLPTRTASTQGRARRVSRGSTIDRARRTVAPRT